ncbi:MAG: DinB family protein [Planctomycetes bacterium]|nr:DinB family protein [Planctomycetota bacterium]
MPATRILRTMRDRIRTLAESIPREEAFAVPPGFSNNIAWNIGHIFVTHQILCYELSGLPMKIEPELRAMFAKGTSPASWKSEPDLELLYPKLTDLAEVFERDYAAGLFEHYQPYTTSAGVELRSIEDAIAFNNVHEGIHLGYVMAMRHVL